MLPVLRLLLLGFLLLLAPSVEASASLPGRILKVPRDAYEAGIPPKSWWVSHSDDFSDEWKKQKLDLRHTQVRLHRIVPGHPLEQGKVLPVSQLGEFEVPELPSGEYFLDVQHVAYKFNPVLISVDNAEVSIFRLEAHKGIKHISGFLSSLTIRPERFDSPYPTPEGINIFKYLKNPMVIMLLITGFLGIVMPRLMDSDAMAELQQEQAADRKD
eukprot:Protomagalhaensia_wolfi_Nauph_80__932@NODE_1538_length_1482_cov_26_568954_g1193_i0_p2_GENE_NODE_1538_length_1482_cov_26_568954_g1193_i0NODE_1538_length_1482_cov_26_568954_g1193_i0_p2_ORF_typecomplete_len214_score37_54DUF2012/PF09430_10/1_1e11CarbopepD_reg_2/PF13715_6/0_081CarboxypepD_reg/PF13620_6/0_35_NODE_1538_length_1482_cov_26_568954_g1193_i07721413